MDTDSSYGTLSQFIDVLLAQGHRDIRIIEPTPMGNDTTWLTFSTACRCLDRRWETDVLQQNGKIYPIILF